MSDIAPPPLKENPPRLSLGEHVRELSWSPDSTQVAAALSSGEVVIVDTTANLALRRWEAHKFGVLRVSWSSKGSWLASSGEDRFLRWWNPANGTLISEQQEKAWVEQLSASPDGESLASGSGKALKLWNAPGVCSFSVEDHDSTIAALQWRADSKGIATACFGRVQLFRLGEPNPYETLLLKTSHVSLGWSPNGRHIAAGSQENSVTYWKLPFRDREPLQMSGYPAKVRALSWDRESRYLATGGGELITVWNVTGRGPAGSKPSQLKGHRQKISCLTFQKRSDVLASGCAGGSVWLWTPSRGDGGMPAAQLEAEITSLVWSPDETQLAIASADGTLQIIR